MHADHFVACESRCRRVEMNSRLLSVVNHLLNRAIDDDTSTTQHRALRVGKQGHIAHAHTAVTDSAAKHACSERDPHLVLGDGLFTGANPN
jgi:hypothetical protein